MKSSLLADPPTVQLLEAALEIEPPPPFLGHQRECERPGVVAEAGDLGVIVEVFEGDLLGN